MQKFLIRCLLFLLPVVMILGGIECLLRQLPNSYRQKYEWMTQRASEVHTLILGNSHGLFGIRPDLLKEPAYNLCNVSQLYEYDEYLLHRFMPQCQKLHTVVLVVDNSGLFDPPLELGEPFRCAYYRLYMDYPKHSLISKYAFELSYTSAAVEKLKNWAGREGDDCDSLGWNRLYQLAKRDSCDLTEEAARHVVARHNSPGLTYAENNREILLRMAAYCQQQQIRLILLQTPVMAAYQHAIAPQYSHFLQQTLRTCKNRFGAEIIDFSTDSRFADDKYFFDVDHLSDVGAAKFSRLLDAKIRDDHAKMKRPAM